MSRFFRSAPFPILIVVVLAFFASKLISSNTGSVRPHTYQTLVSQNIPNGEVHSRGHQDQGQRRRSPAEERRKVRSRLRPPGLPVADRTA